MISITEMRDLTETTAKSLFDGHTLRKDYFDYGEANIFGTGRKQDSPLKKADRQKVLETLRGVPLREFLAKSGSTGIAGAAYLVPDKIYQVMYDSAVEEDIVAAVSITLLGPEQIPGTTLKVDIAVDDSFQPRKFRAGGKMAEDTLQTVQATLDFTDAFGLNFPITNDLIEDSQFDVIEMHVRNAGREMGEFATNEALGILKLAADGDGLLNSGASGDADETKWTGGTTNDFETAILANNIDGFRSDTCVMSLGAMLHSVYTTIPNYSEPWIGNILANGWPSRIGPLNVLYTEVDTITNSKAGTNLVTCIFSKEYSLLSGRKRWLRMQNYSDPVQDLVGATVSARQDSVSIYDDSVFTLTET